MADVVTRLPSRIDAVADRRGEPGPPTLASGVEWTIPFEGADTWGGDFAFDPADPTVVRFVGPRPLVCWMRFFATFEKASPYVASAWRLRVRINGNQGPEVEYPQSAGPSSEGAAKQVVNATYPHWNEVLSPGDEITFHVTQFSGSTFTAREAAAIIVSTGFGLDAAQIL